MYLFARTGRAVEDYIVIVGRGGQARRTRQSVMIALSLTGLPGKTTLANPNSAYLLLRSDCGTDWG